MQATKLDPAQVARASNPELIHVQVPIEVMWNFDRMVDIKKEVIGRLGCLSCTSGFDIRFRGLRDFVVNPAGEIREFNELHR
jgi:hypothetical protein